MPHPDDTSPDPMKLPEEGLFETPFGDEPAVGTPPDALAAGAEADAAETTEEPAGGKKKKREKKTKDRKDKKAAKAQAPAKTPGPPLLTRMRKASPYTVMLAVASSALAIGILFLVLYLARYGFKIHP